MPLSAEEQALYDHGQAAVPKWFFSSTTATFEWLLAFTKSFDRVRQYINSMLDATYLETAAGIQLDQHAKDRGTSRRLNETDAALRSRLKTPEDALTELALMSRIHAIVNASGVSNIVVAATSTFTIDDGENDPKVISVAAATYTVPDLVTLIQNQLPSKWSFRIINGYSRFWYPTSAFSVTWSGTTFRNQLGYTGDAVSSVTYYDSPNKVTGPQAAMVSLRRDRAHCHVDGVGAGSCTGFLSRGYRATNANRPSGYVAILPYGTSAATRTAVLEYLRLYGPAGYGYYVEVRANP